MGRRVGVDTPLGRDPQRLRADRDRRLVVGGARRRPPLHGQRRREGHRLAPPARHRHARPRLDAVRVGQRAGQGGRGRAPAWRRTGRRAQISDIWRGQVAAMPLPDEVRAGLLDPAPHLGDARDALPDVGAPGCATPMTHTTFSPNVAHGGQKTNIIPDVVDLEVDIRTVPGTTREPTSRRTSHEALGELAHHVEVGRPAGLAGHRVADRATRCGTRSRPARRSRTRVPS